MKNNRKNRALLKIRIRNNLRKAFAPLVTKEVTVTPYMKEIISLMAGAGFNSKEITVYKGASIGFSTVGLPPDEWIKLGMDSMPKWMAKPELIKR